MLFVLLTFCFSLVNLSFSCSNRFEGFGVHVGQLKSFNRTDLATIKSLFEVVYHDLGIRHFRTEYLHEFSRSPHHYSIECEDLNTCTWIHAHQVLSTFPDIKVFASIWSPPHYMKTKTLSLPTLKRQAEQDYYFFIKNVTAMIREKFNINVEKISIINEPEDVFAQWDHTNMSPGRLCRLVDTFDDDQLRICPETAWFNTARFYLNHPNCQSACHVIATHGYRLVGIGGSPFGQVHYDLKPRFRSFQRPLWLTEISSPSTINGEPQMQEAIDLSISIVNYVGVSCVSRFYYWLAFTTGPTGESLIWLNQNGHRYNRVYMSNNYDQFVFPKKYWAYRHFALSSQRNGQKPAHLCSEDSSNFYCLRFGKNYIFVNNDANSSVRVPFKRLCCTTDSRDFQCGLSFFLPPKSICSVNSQRELDDNV